MMTRVKFLKCVAGELSTACMLGARWSLLCVGMLLLLLMRFMLGVRANRDKVADLAPAE